eukprot:2199238-Alexandrium_andersonii.AAC.1
MPRRPNSPHKQSTLLPRPVQDLADCLERRALNRITAGQAPLAIHAGVLAVVAAVVGVNAFEAVLLVILGGTPHGLAAAPTRARTCPSKK